MWRFFGFVALVIAGLAAVFYFKGQAEDEKGVQSAKKSEQRTVVATPIDSAKDPAIKVSNPPKSNGIGSFGSSIIIQAELKPKEEQEVTFEVENTAASIEQLVKDIGNEVKPGDLLVKMEDIMIKARLEGQFRTATELSDAKIKSAENAQEVYDKEVNRNQKLANTGAASPADLELSIARREQAKYDIIKSQVEKKVEESRLKEVSQQAELFQIKSRIPGTIVKVYKKKGASVRGGEPIMHIVNDKTLLVDGAFESGFSSRINQGKTVIVEPENDREAQFIFNGHTGTVTGMSLAPLNRFFASSSDDGTVILWNLAPATSLPWLRLERPDQRRVACKCVAVSPAVNEDTYLLLAGYSDGVIYQWTVKIDAAGSPKVEAKILEKGHDQAVNCIAFRGDGVYAASGSDDRRVALWNVTTGKKLYFLQADSSSVATTHFGSVTSVSFSKNGQHLLTAGTDNSLRRWKLGSDKSELVKATMGRSGDVKHFSPSNDARYAFSEHGDELRLLDSRTLEPVSVINSRRQGRFVQFANLSPNGEWAVAATDQGRNLLIRLPKLAAETATDSKLAPPPGATPVTPASANSTDLWLRDGSIGAHFTLPEAVRATCAFFLTGPQQSYVFMGSTDFKIRLWQLPTKEELTTPYLAKLVFKSPQVESGTGLIRVQAEYDNTGARKLDPGKRVTMLVYPDAVDGK